MLLFRSGHPITRAETSLLLMLTEMCSENLKNGIAYNQDKKMLWICDSSYFDNDSAYPYKYEGDIADLNGIHFKIGKYSHSSENALIVYKLTEEYTLLGTGVFDKNFNMVIPFEYQDIQALSDDYFLVSEKTSWWTVGTYRQKQ